MMVEAIKFDETKPRMDLIPAKPIFALARVLTFGAIKYGDRNWEVGMMWGRLFAAALRHLWAWWGGESKDPETGESHLAHALCCIVFLMEYEETHPGFDDRPFLSNLPQNSEIK
ncbi:MAG: DUF5664 domain-containing protein [Clostridia bacterium]|nr:DUF5664 domain-containing protein [Clostridia bacterium]